MNKKLTVVLSVLLILVLCAALTACEGTSGSNSAVSGTSGNNAANGGKFLAVGDTFPYAGGTLTVQSIKDGTEDLFGSDELGEPEGRWVCVNLSAENLESHLLSKEEFVLNGKTCAAYSPEVSMPLGGGSYEMTGLNAVFDVDKNTPLTQLRLEVTMIDATEAADTKAEDAEATEEG